MTGARKEMNPAGACNVRMEDFGPGNLHWILVLQYKRQEELQY